MSFLVDWPLRAVAYEARIGGEALGGETAMIECGDAFGSAWAGGSKPEGLEFPDQVDELAQSNR